LGASNYGGPTNINGGDLRVNGSITSPVAVNTGGTLSGIGAVGPSNVNTGGTLAPGDAGIGTITVNGALALQVASFYIVQVLNTTSDKTNASGTGILNGSVNASFTGINLVHIYDILSVAGGRNGTFSSVTATGLPSFLSASPAQEPDGRQFARLLRPCRQWPGRRRAA
jgi:uncharacterized protein with beta-barrel porin domain